MGRMTAPEAPVAVQANAFLLELALRRLGAAIPSDPELRRHEPLPAVVEDLHRDELSAIEVFARACEAYADRPALGERACALEGPPGAREARPLPGFQAITYGAAWRRVVHLATGLVRDPRTALRPGEVAALHGFASPEYVLADLACLYAGAVSAVLQATMGGEDLRHIADEAAYACIVCTLESWPTVLEVLPACRSVRSVVLMDLRGTGQEAEELERARALSPVPLLTLAELDAAGRATAPLAPFRPAPGTDPLATLMYTSGSTGFPKGAMLTQGIWRSHWTLNALSRLVRFPHVGINFYPLSHAMGRLAVLRAFVLGGVTHFTLKSDLSTLFEDIRLARPTFLNLVPRVSEMIHQAFRTDLRRRLEAGAEPARAQEQACAAMRSSFLGDRLTAAVIGSAPTAPEVVEFLTGCFEIPVYEGYGSTEAGIITLDGQICRPLVAAYKLAEVPELGYRLDDQPYPRGELLVKTRQCIPGYHHNPAATQALYDQDGFQRTGDIVEERAPDQVAWVDRKNNVIKLAQGEFVTIWRLESAYSAGSPYLDQVYLYANSSKSYPLAVAVPHWPSVRERLGQAPEPEALRKLLRSEFNRVAAEARLRPFEVPRDFLVEEQRWTRENGLLTGVDKPARPQLRRKYGERLDALYAGLEHQRQEELAALQRDGAGATAAEQVSKAAAAVLGVPGLDLDAGSFTQLGGDSIGALTLAGLLEETCGVPVPVGVILNPGAPLRSLVRHLEARRGPGAGAMPTFGDVHGRSPSLIRAEDLGLPSFLSPADLEAGAAVADQPLPAQVRSVLITGASGFLGHILCLEWLERMAEAGGRVCALVRAADDRAAAARLESVYRGLAPAMEQRFDALAGRLTVLAGDLAAPGLGLAPERYRELADTVDLIVHPGALVNHVLGYEHLFTPNVAGTAQVARLALRGRRKRVDFVSTVGVLAGAKAPGKVPEQAGVDALQPAWPVTGGYAHGYAVSKWAGEVLMQDLHQRFRTPVRVFRCDMILPHRRYRGQVNVPDLLTRLLVSVIRTGLAPASFYSGGRAARAHFDGLPVDFIASAMTALSSAWQEDHATYQVSNAHWSDGISLDTLMDWVETAGYPLDRIGDHAAWYQAFGARLRELPPDLLQHSSLPILDQWAKPLHDWERERVDGSRFVQQVRRHQPGGEPDIPHLTEGFLHKYLADLRVLGLLPE